MMKMMQVMRAMRGVRRPWRALVASRRRTLVASAWSAGCVVAGCTGGGPPVGVADAAVPRDLTIDVTVLVGPAVATAGGAAVATTVAAESGESVDKAGAEGFVASQAADGAQRRQGKYIVFPDGTLHADVGASLRADVRPGVTRQLTAAQLEDLWTSARRLGLADPDNGQLPGNDALVVAAPDQVVHVVTFLADGRAWRFVRKAAADGALDPATSPFVRDLAALAWVGDEPPASRRPAVVRYDFGSDPYSMYRRPAEGEGGRGAPMPR